MLKQKENTCWLLQFSSVRNTELIKVPTENLIKGKFREADADTDSTNLPKKNAKYPI